MEWVGLVWGLFNIYGIDFSPQCTRSLRLVDVCFVWFGLVDMFVPGRYWNGLESSVFCIAYHDG